MEGDFELSIIRKNNKFQCHIIIHFGNDTKIDNQEFSNYKKLLKFLKSVIKGSDKFYKAMVLLKEFERQIEGSE